MKFKVGDQVIVFAEDGLSSDSRIFSGQTIVITEVNFHKSQKEYYICSKEAKDGIWVNEIRHLTKLERALK